MLMTEDQREIFSLRERVSLLESGQKSMREEIDKIKTRLQPIVASTKPEFT